jgi:two-component system nitrogen regulation response regulator GlnG
MSHVLVVDDEPAICWGFRELLRGDGHDVTIASSAEEMLQVAGPCQPDAVILDVRLPGQDGLSVMSRLRDLTGDAPIIVITAFGNLETAVRAVEEGAFDYLTKPFDLDDAAAVIRRALHARTSVRSVVPQTGLQESNEPLIGSSPAMQTVFRQIALVAQSDAAVLITGESGTGKELVARAIHRHSPRKSGPFVPISLAAYHPAAVEGELFGFAKGAGTGSESARKGLLESAGGGTVLLDGISDVSVPVQVKLLRAIEQQEILPVGGSRTKPVDFRVVAATDQELRALMDRGEFRDDLFFRLSVVQIELPPLRERAEDIPPLAEFFLRQCSDAESPKQLSTAALCELGGRSWPGNVRELRNAVEHAAIMSRGKSIEVSDLPPAATFTTAGGGGAIELLQREVARWAVEQVQPLDATTTEASLYEDFIQSVEPPLLKAVLDRCGNNRAAAARLLGLHRATLRQKLKNHGITGPDDES